MKYLVLECHPGYAVVLSENGEAKKVANMQYQVGQTVDEVVEMMSPPTKPQHRLKGKWLYGVAALAASLLLMITSTLTVGRQPYASVYLTINPEVRIDVDRRDRVMDVEGLNADGEQLLEGYDYDDKQLDQTMDELVDRAIDMGFLHEGGQITLTLDAEDGEWRKQHEVALGAHLDQYLQEKMQVVIQIEGSNIQQNSTVTNHHEIVIPVTPQGGKDDDSKHEISNEPQTDYGESDYGESSYEEGLSDYGESSYEESLSDYGESNYDDGPTDYEKDMSDYDTSEEADEVSDYDEPVNENDASDYDEIEDDDDMSDYDESEVDVSDYDEDELQHE